MSDVTYDEGVSIISAPPENAIEQKYLAARDREQRLLNDEEVFHLPDINASHPHHREWQLRKKSYLRLREIILKKNPSSMLDIGCGNGWLIGNLQELLPQCTFAGVDLNLPELKQAQRLFGSEKSTFYYLNIMQDDYFEPESFDLIVFSASIQYFPSASAVMERCKSLLRPGGLLIVNDSPVYADKAEAQQAAERSKAYYTKLGVPEMAQHYFHHTADDFAQSDLRRYSRWNHVFHRYPFSVYLYEKSS